MPDHKPVIAIFDVGKTNKKLLLFDKYYKVVFEKSHRIPEIKDEDGFPCEDMSALKKWICNSVEDLLAQKDFEIAAINFSAYGASFVLVDGDLNPVAPMYNYLKPFPNQLLKAFYSKYGGELNFSIATASPALGNLNSGLQLYRLKYQQPAVFLRTKYALHLPQYISGIITKEFYSDLTSIGCHTALWDFNADEYHKWVKEESVLEKLAPIVSSSSTTEKKTNSGIIKIGAGLHDSSAALIPYLRQFSEEFILISTGTWSISLNPFNKQHITAEELKSDCLCYLQYQGSPVKASRLFLGNEHELQLKRISEHFNVNEIAILEFDYDSMLNTKNTKLFLVVENEIPQFEFRNQDLSQYHHFSTAYLDLLFDLVRMQLWSTGIILKNTSVRNIYVDGGFSNNKIFMQLLAAAFSQYKVFAAAIPQSTALGAALAIHDSWNDQLLSDNLIELRSISS
ncbi:MAG: carbohydrate kinase [Bacteroidetes bacterium]|nr:MAG: carbohydrate kinase [Bacteroidota bacterium]